MTTTDNPAPQPPQADWDAHYKVPVIHHRAPSSMALGDFGTNVHKVPLDGARSIDFYGKLNPARELFVSLHGAVPATAPRYPHFRRVESMRSKVDALLCIADPTLLVGANDEFRLAWYAGSEDWDPTNDLANIVRAAMTHVGATRVMFLGGSGGGFASLRLSTLFPGSMAFVQDPQTDVAEYYLGHRQRMFAAAWPSWAQEDAFAAFPHRFDMKHHYSDTDPDNFVYYRQSTSDEMHVKKHAEPFERTLSLLSGAAYDRFHFAYEEGEKPGHGKITPAEFDRHFDAAMQFWAR